MAGRNGLSYAFSSLFSSGRPASTSGATSGTVTLEALVDPSISPHQLAREGRLSDLKMLVEERGVLSVVDDSGSTVLHAASGQGQTSVMQYLIEEGIDLDATDNHGNTALHTAVKSRSVEGAHLLLSRGASSTVCNDCGDPPLHTALRNGDITMVSVMLEHKVDVLVRGFRGRTAFHIIAENDLIEMLKVLYGCTEAFSSRSEAEMHPLDKAGITPIHLAARKGSCRVLEYMFMKSLEHGHRPEVVLDFLDEENSTPLQFAVEGGSTRVVEVLLKFGSSPTLTKGTLLPPVHLASSHGRLDMLQAMVGACGPGILATVDCQGKTPLHHAVSCINAVGIISYVSDHMENLDIRDHRQHTPLLSAVLCGSLDATNELLGIGCDPTLQDQAGQNALHLAIRGGREELVKSLLCHSTAPTLLLTPNTEGDFPIQLALTSAQRDLASLVLESISTHQLTETCGWDRNNNNYLHLTARTGNYPLLLRLLELPRAHQMLNELNMTGSTPLHYAAVGGNTDCVNILINKGGVVHRCYSGQTPFMYACASGHFETAKALFEAHPFQRDWVDNNGNTALHLAAQGGSSAVLKFCLDVGVPVTLNNDGESFFDLILHKVDRELAMVSLQHQRWQDCLDKASSYSPHPILRLIERLPETIQVVFDNSHRRSQLGHKHPDHWEEFDFKYLHLSHTCPCENGVKHPQESPVETDMPTSDGLEPSTPTVATSPRHTSRRERPLEVLHWMLKYKRKAYLTHPVIVAYLNHKWSSYARPLYLVVIVLHLLLTVFLSVFIGITPPPTHFLNDTMAIEDSVCTSSNVIRFLTLFICVLSTLLWGFLLYVVRLKLFNLQESAWLWFSAVTTVCTYVFLIPWNGLDGVVWEAGAIAVFCSWLTLPYHLQLFEVGLYVIMFVRVTKTVLLVLLFSTTVILAFAFPLYILVGSLQGLPFSTFGYSLFTTFSYLLAGPIDFTALVNLDASDVLRFTPLTFIFTLMATVFLPVIVINLIIGLAVGDIDHIRQEAVINRREVEVRVLRHIDERVMPQRLLRRLEKQSLKCYPNARDSYWSKFKHHFWSKVQSDTAGEQAGSQEETLALEAKVEQCQQRLEQMARCQQHQLEALERLEEMVARILQNKDK